MDRGTDGQGVLSIREKELSPRQFRVLLAAALLMPVTALLPTMTARLAGSAGWLSPAGAIPLLLAACWAAHGAYPNEGSAVAGKIRCVLVILYLAWTFLILMLSLRLSGARLAKVYGTGTAAVYTVFILLAAVWLGRKKIQVLARAGEIFYLVLGVLLAGVLLLGAFHVEAESFAVSAEELAGLPRSSAAAAGLLLNIYPAVILKGGTSGGCGKASVWVLAFCAAAALLLGAVIGCLGAGLTAEIPSPFFVMVQGLEIPGVFQRAEALVIALWTLSDLTLTGLLLHTWRGLADRLCPERWSRASVIPAAALAMLGGWGLFSDETDLWLFSSTVLPVLGLIWGLVCPAAVRILWGKRKEKTP